MCVRAEPDVNQRARRRHPDSPSRGRVQCASQHIARQRQRHRRPLLHPGEQSRCGFSGPPVLSRWRQRHPCRRSRLRRLAQAHKDQGCKRFRGGLAQLDLDPLAAASSSMRGAGGLPNSNGQRSDHSAEGQGRNRHCQESKKRWAQTDPQGDGSSGRQSPDHTNRIQATERIGGGCRRIAASSPGHPCF